MLRMNTKDIKTNKNNYRYTKKNKNSFYNQPVINTQILNDKLKNIIDNKKKNDVTKLLESEQIFVAIGNKADNYTNNLMLKLYGRLGEVEKAEQIFEKLVLPSAISSNNEISDAMMLNAYANSKIITYSIVNKAERLYFAMGKNMSNHVAKDVMLKLYFRYNDLSQDMIKNANTIFTSIINKTSTQKKYIDKIWGNVSTVNNESEKQEVINHRELKSNKSDKLLEYSVKEMLTKEELAEAKKIYYAIEHPTINLTNIMLNLYAHVDITKEGKLKYDVILEAENFYLTFKDRADHVSKGTMLNIYARAERFTHHLQRKVEEIYLSIKDANNLVVLNIMLTLYSNMRIISIDTVNNVLDIYSRLINIQHNSNNGKHDLNVVIKTLTICSKAKDLDDTHILNAKSIYNKRVNCGNKDSQDRLLHNLMIKIYSRANNVNDTWIEEAENIFYSVRYKDIGIYCSILNVYAHAKTMTNELLQKAKNIFFFIDLESIKNYEHNKIQYYKLINIMLNIYANKNDSDSTITRDAEKLYSTLGMVCLNIICFNSMLKVYANTKVADDILLKKIQSIFDNLLCIPNQETVNIMIRIYSKPEVSKVQIENAITYFTKNNISHSNSIATLITHLKKILDNQIDEVPLLNNIESYNINRFFLIEKKTISRTENKFNWNSNTIRVGLNQNENQFDDYSQEERRVRNQILL